MADSIITLNQIEDLEVRLGNHATPHNPGSEEYERCLQRWSAIGYLRPGLVVCPTDAQGIARTVKFAKDHHIDLAVKGGGHSTDTSASSDGGILVDLHHLKQVNVDPVAKTVSAQGGALWADVNQAAAQYQLAVVGGTASQTGVGGLTLRGGYGYLTPQYGLVIDNLLSANVVTAEGAEVLASEKDNPDLFWALRGAGQNVGVVEKFVLQAHPQPNLVWSGIRSYPCDRLPEVIQALNAALVHPQGKAAAQCVLALSPENGSPLVNVVLFFNGCEAEGKKHFMMLLDIKCSSDDVRMRPYLDANTMIDAAVTAGGRKKILGVQLAPPVRSEFASKLMGDFTHQLTIETDMAKSALEFDYFDPSQICCISTDNTAFPARKKILNGALILQWTDPGRDEDILSWGKSIQVMCEEEIRRAGYESTAFVSNFIGYTSEDNVTPADMFGINANRLLDIKKKYDPFNVFHKLNPLNLQQSRQG
ncbi:FAD binding domain protein [Aspergillus lentulus]|uniref:FAD binding domain protein n=1 Tax=Aspergillus lentulus TaxID=293939 RepID=A0ABQ0ZUC1_ASPLE|nr:FAD binding domain protein [Aspergillus lentulus]GFF79614.1 FAD binding domain protein [Aspergillus lentulus]